MCLTFWKKYYSEALFGRGCIFDPNDLRIIEMRLKDGMIDLNVTAQRMKFSIKDFFSKCD